MMKVGISTTSENKKIKILSFTASWQPHRSQRRTDYSTTTISHSESLLFDYQTWQHALVYIRDSQKHAIQKKKVLKISYYLNSRVSVLFMKLIYLCVLSSCAHEVNRVFVRTTLLLEDNLPPLILSPMWWHTLTPTICWNTSSSTQHSGVSRQTTQSNQRGHWVALPRLEAGIRT